MLNLKDNNSLIKKIIFLFVLALLLQIPMFFIDEIVEERNYSYLTMSEKIGEEWGNNQIIAGAFLIIPITREEKENNQKRNRVYNHIVLPETLTIKANLKDEVRKRGIYKTTVYTSDINIEGTFPPIILSKDYPYNISIGLGITDTKSIMKVKEFLVEGEKIEFESGTGISLPELKKGISGIIKQNLNDKEKIHFSIKLTLRGSEGIALLPFGKENLFEITSSWQSPSFNGILPNEKIIDTKGFKAVWELSSFVRNYKQDFTEYNDLNLREGQIGVDLYEGVTHYRQVMRAIKYSMLFTILTLFIVYIFEVTSKRFTHYIQYGVVGFSLALFYLSLLSMSEFFNFNLSYIIASLMVIIPNSLYLKAVTKNKNYGLGMFVFLTGIYTVLYAILQMEQYALITGTALLMLVLYTMMYLTRNIENFKLE